MRGIGTAPWHGGGVLRALLGDIRGNTLAIMAAALIPLAGMVGGGIDISRMYITKTRLQHACDAGALAGRKNQGGGAWDSTDNDVAKKFFDANYQNGAYGTSSATTTAAAPDRSFSENAGKVTGTASVRLPMTLTRVIRADPTATITVTCDAEMKLPNTDVMFVLDVTGSMNCVAGDTSCSNNGGVPAAGSKIDGLKDAVKCFYEVLAQLDTNANCGSTPSGGTSSAVQIRFGFMPYASNVNVGHLLPPSYFADSWTYQSRLRDPVKSDWSDWQTVYTDRDAGEDCPSYDANNPSRQWRNGEKGRYSNGNRYCQYDYRFYGRLWNYGPTAVNVSLLKSGTSWNPSYSFSWPINNDGSNRTITWDGCIEERKTVRAASYDPIPDDAASGNKAYDLDIDSKPETGKADTFWGPSLPSLLYYRKLGDTSAATTSLVASSTNYYNSVDNNCPTEAKKLQSWANATTFSAYVDSLVATGNTYHDIGMLWGARFMSPTGIFKADNELAANGGQIQRHMIFMTDGDSTSSPCDYNAYGAPFWDQRETTDVGDAKNCFSNRQALIDQINVRLETLCKAVKKKGITLWVISFGGGVNSTTEDRLSKCASDPDTVVDSYYMKATTNSELTKKFAIIANAISQLRLTK